MSKKPQSAFGIPSSIGATALTVSLVISVVIVFITTTLIIEQFGSVWPIGRVVAVSILFFGTGLILLIFAYQSAKEKLRGYVGAVATTIVFILITYSDLARILSTASDPNFYRTMAFVFASVANVGLGLLLIVNTIKHRTAERKRLSY